MEKKILIIFATALFLFGMVGFVNAAPTLYSDLTAWQGAVGSYSGYTDYGTEGSSLTVLDVGYGESISFSPSTTIYTVGSSWLTWSGGYTGDILYSGSGVNSLSVTFADGGLLDGFGFFAQPQPFGSYDITLNLITGDTLTQSVHGFAGADFFGWTTDVALASFTLSSTTSFAIGDFYSSDAPPAPVPEPATILIMGTGLLGLVIYNRKRFSQMI